MWGIRLHVDGGGAARVGLRAWLGLALVLGSGRRSIHACSIMRGELRSPV